MSGNIRLILMMTTVMAALCLAVGIVAAAPLAQNISYQGKLTDAAGNPLTGSYTMTFRLYDVETGGTALDTIIQDVVVDKGLFTVRLAFNPGLFDGRAFWLGVKAGADPEMSPRQEILPVPYALALASGVHEQVLAIVTDIQAKVNTLVTGLAGLQADVTTIKNKLNAPPVPIRYEYYSAPMYTLKTLSTVQDYTTVTNSGDSPASVCYYKYLKQGTGDFALKTSQCITLLAGKTQSCTPTLVGNSTYQWKVKFTTNSSYVMPYTCLIEGGGPDQSNIYHPRDFHKVEIYS